MSDEFEAIEPAAKTVTVGGRDFQIAPITVERLPAFARALRPILPAVAELLAISDDADPNYVGDLLLGLLADSGELLIEALAAAVATDRADIPAKRAAIGRLDAADFALLAIPVVRANVDFFARRLLPLMNEARSAAKPPSGDGPTPSSA